MQFNGNIVKWEKVKFYQKPVKFVLFNHKTCNFYSTNLNYHYSFVRLFDVINELNKAISLSFYLEKGIPTYYELKIYGQYEGFANFFLFFFSYPIIVYRYTELGFRPVSIESLFALSIFKSINKGKIIRFHLELTLHYEPFPKPKYSSFRFVFGFFFLGICFIWDIVFGGLIGNIYF